MKSYPLSRGNEVISVDEFFLTTKTKNGLDIS